MFATTVYEYEELRIAHPTHTTLTPFWCNKILIPVNILPLILLLILKLEINTIKLFHHILSSFLIILSHNIKFMKLCILDWKKMQVIYRFGVAHMPPRAG